MTLDWPNLGVGALIGFPVGVLAHWVGAYLNIEKLMERRALGRKYKALAGSYANFRRKDNGTYEPTGGKIILRWERNGSFKEEGLHSNGVAEWRGIIHMNLENAGNGEYRNIQSRGYGNQIIYYIPETKYFDVMTTFTNPPSPEPFYHQWRRIEG